MNEHPPSYRLDAMALPGTHAHREEDLSHVAACEACTLYVNNLRAAMLADANAAVSEDAFMAKLAAAEKKDQRPIPRPTVVRLVPYATALLAAAAVFLYIRATPSPRPDVAEPIATDQVRFKGGMQLAVVRERDGVQERFTDVALIRTGDRLRAEVATDHEGPLEIGILQNDGAYLPLLAPTALPLGAHFSDRAAKVDDHPAPGWLLAGHPDAVKHARETRDLTKVHVIPIRVQ